jgi:hypothetical protein
VAPSFSTDDIAPDHALIDLPRRLACVCRSVYLGEHARVTVPARAELLVDCGGGFLSLHSPLGSPSLGENAFVSLSNCHLTTFSPGSARDLPLDAPDHPSQWMHAKNAMLFLEDSFVEEPCSVRASGHSSP